ncbi:hypothetical protein NA78x_003148 [Anatilimnocola sp. NA78]|uniref:hypothetical protein n=1 Tax=Anatilimnocola sp. NA78 TaxID=3415683 RepID=UPI003CE52F82
MFGSRLQSGISHVGQALQMPEEFAVAWNNRTVRYRWWVWGSLMATAILGTTTYGMTMGLLGGTSDVLYKGLACTLAAGLAWGISLPALYILNSLSGSRLPASSTLLAALVTTSWGGRAMLASIPINWFFSVAVPHPTFVLIVNLIVFTGVGVAMMDVFRRVMRSLEPTRPLAPIWWLFLVGVIGAELFYFFGLFQFHAIS